MKKPFAAREGVILPESGRAFSPLRQSALTYRVRTFSTDRALEPNELSAPAGGFTSTRFILVEPSHPGNVGAAARALKTMGFARLVLVAPREADVKNQPEAIAMASGADDVLASAHVVDTLAQALTGVHWSVALTARLRESAPPQQPPRAAAERAREFVRHGDIAFVFG